MTTYYLTIEYQKKALAQWNKRIGFYTPRTRCGNKRLKIELKAKSNHRKHIPTPVPIKVHRDQGRGKGGGDKWEAGVIYVDILAKEKLIIFQKMELPERPRDRRNKLKRSHRT